MDSQTNRTSGQAEIREYLRPLLRRWWLILGIVSAVTAITYFHFALQPPRYTASTSMLIQPASLNTVLTGQVTPSGDPDRVANNQATLVKSEAVAARVAKDLGYRGNPTALLGAVTVGQLEETDFLQIAATAGSPQLAADIANAFARAYRASHDAESRREAEKAIKSAQRRLKSLPTGSREFDALSSKVERVQVLRDLPSANVRQLDPAKPPGEPNGPDPVRNALFGFVVALLLAGGAAYALEMLDRRIRCATDIELLYGSPVLTELPHVRETTDAVEDRLAIPRPLTEGFRGLRMNLQLTSSLDSELRGELPRTILVASAIAGEGKSTVVRNLAIAYREAGMSVAVVDADLRKPTLSHLMVDDPTPGLLEVLTGAAGLDDALRPVELHVEGLATISRVHQAMQQLRGPQEVKGATAVGSAPSWPARRADVGSMPRPIGSGSAPSQHPLPGDATQAPWAARAMNGNGTGNGNGNGTGGQLALLGSGTTPADPGAVLASARFQVILKELTARFDVVLIDSSPLLPVSDALPLLSIVDGVVLTSRVGVTTRSAARQLVDTVERVPGASVLGVVANDVKSSESSRHYDYGYNHYGSASQSHRGG